MKQSNIIAIRNGHIIDPANGIDKKMDLYLQGEQILALCRPGVLPDNLSDATQITQIIDAKDMVVCPGFVDLRTRLREPGQEHKGTIASETYAAASGGVTSISCPPDTNPIIDNTSTIKLIRVKAQTDGFTHVYPMAAMSKGLKGEELSEMKVLMDAGCVGISNAMRPMANTLVMRRVLEYAASHNIKVFIHPQDYWLGHNGSAHEGAMSVRLGLTGIPECAETIALARDLQLIDLTGASAHFCNVTTAKGVSMIREAKAQGMNITADTTAHHLHLTDMDIGYFNSNCHIMPPLRSQRDMEALKEGVADGTIDAIVSDHQPHDQDAKLAPFSETEPGISSVETLFPLSLKMAEAQGIKTAEVISKLSQNPANILGIPAGTLSPGANADICIFAPDDYYMVKTDEFHSHGHNSPFNNWELKGRISQTLVMGRVVFQRNLS